MKRRRMSLLTVAIGASAGGIEAVKKLFSNLPPDTGMAFLYVQHLDPTHFSNLDAILTRVTGIPVSQVTAPVDIEPDHLYICPPGKDLIVEKRKLTLAPHPTQRRGNRPIDLLFQSVAANFRENSIGVLLSGNSSDGAAGLRAIKSTGGTTFVQDKTAKFPVMPESGISAGAADFVLPPERIAAELVRRGNRKYFSKFPQPGSDPLIPDDDKAFHDIVQLLYRRTAIDFGRYKKPIVIRRIARRIRLNKLETFAEYAQFLVDHEAEANALCQDMVIKSTSFFRSREAIAAVKRTVIPRILRSKKPGEPVRVWVSGCSTGQEAYSIAILLLESLAAGRPPGQIRIFATDISDKLLVKARSGVYSKEEVKGVSSERLEKFFIKVPDGYQVIKPVRELCVFSRHDVLSNPPFTRIDLVSCSNLLPELQTVFQKKVIATFHFALQPNGFLLLGRSESIGTARQLFTRVNKKFKIYSSLTTSSPPPRPEMTHRRPPGEINGLSSTVNVRRGPREKEKTLKDAVDDFLLKSCTPPCVVINEKMDILEFRGNTGPFLEHPAGKAALNLLKMARGGLGIEIKRAVKSILKNNERYEKDGIGIPAGDKTTSAAIEVVRLPSGTSPVFLVLFMQTPVTDHRSRATGGQSRKKVRALEAELVTAREEIRSIVGEQQTINEELQSANEEALSSNEELQSINEELETSKEELESTNMELTSVNSELQHKNLELAEAKKYSDIIISTIEEAVLVLNMDLTVKMANKTFFANFRLTPAATHGKRLFDIGTGEWDLPELHTLFRDVVSADDQAHTLEANIDFRDIGQKNLVFHARKLDKQTFGQPLIFVAIEDITRRVAAEKIVAEREAWFHTIADQTPALIWVAGPDQQRIFFNRTWLEFTGRSMDEEIGFGWTTDVHAEDRAGLLALYEKSFVKRQPFQCEYRLRRHDGQYRWIAAFGKPLFGPDGSFSGFLGACNEIHDQRMANEDLERRIEARTLELSQALAREKDVNEMKSRFVAIASHEFRTPLTAILSSVALLEKYSPEQYESSRGKHLARIKSSINILKEILNDFHSVERLEENKVQVTREKFLVDDEIKDVEEAVKGILKPGQYTEYHHSGDREVWADKKILRNILINLLSNASKFSEPHQGIRMESRHIDGKLAISITDNGIGIPKKDQKQLFERFFRAENAANIQGTGLGLNIVRRYVDLVGGHIRLKSRVHRGSSFTVEMPVNENIGAR